MFGPLASKLFGSRNQRLVKRLQKTVQQINALEDEFAACDDAQLRDKTAELQQRVRDGASLDDILPEAFAVVREGGKRVFDMRHFDVQLVGAMVLHQGKIAEMRTGEGKTLVATLAAYLNALSGNGVHVITVNDYLARRDAAWMGRLYEFLGLSVGVVVSGQDPEEKRAAYAADITYGTNNEYGFDYLRDNMAFRAEDKVQRPLNFAIIDEVDSILIDEARTPLIISGPSDDDTGLYVKINIIIPQLERGEPGATKEDEPTGDFTIDEKAKQVHLTEQGYQHAEKLLTELGLIAEDDSLYSASNVILVHHLNAALRANYLFQKDVEYIARNDEIIIVDEFTGRIMPGRRWSDGLHQAIEAKEGVTVQRESQTMASITFQNFFRLYNKLSGMTGTADTEAFEFQDIYGLEVVVIPTHRPTVRDDRADLVYLSQREKYQAIVADIKTINDLGQPILVGTTSIEASELIASELKQANIPHEVLNAKQHAREADIIAQAGRAGAVTIATNMAGRGTDIVLGGNLEAQLAALGDNASEAKIASVRAEWETSHQKVLELGGLHVIGTERHESRRIDNQLRGRSGRQGDPGSTQFYLALDDSLMRIFASPRLQSMMQKMGMEDGEAIQHRWVTRAIENAQKKVEAHNFDIRKNLLEYDDVANDQRKVIYEQRDELLSADNIAETITNLRYDVLETLVNGFVPLGSVREQWDLPSLQTELNMEFGLVIDLREWEASADPANRDTLLNLLTDQLEHAYAEKEQQTGSEVLRHFEKAIMLQILDSQWKEHLAAMDYLRQGIHLRGYAQKNPKQEYKREAFQMFERLLENIKAQVIATLSKVEIRAEEDVQAVEEQRRQSLADAQAPDEAAAPAAEPAPNARPRVQVKPRQAPPQQQGTLVRRGAKVGRNEPCPCGSGKKYKQCHGKAA